MRTTSRQPIGGATKKRDQPEWSDSRTPSGQDPRKIKEADMNAMTMVLLPELQWPD